MRTQGGVLKDLVPPLFGVATESQVAEKQLHGNRKVMWPAVLCTCLQFPSLSAVQILIKHRLFERCFQHLDSHRAASEGDINTTACCKCSFEKEKLLPFCSFSPCRPFMLPILRLLHLLWHHFQETSENNISLMLRRAKPLFLAGWEEGGCER